MQQFFFCILVFFCSHNLIFGVHGTNLFGQISRVGKFCQITLVCVQCSVNVNPITQLLFFFVFLFFVFNLIELGNLAICIINLDVPLLIQD